MMSLFGFVTAMMPPAEGGDGSGSLVSTLIMFGGIILIFYFMILRPQKKRQQEHQKLIDNIKQGDKIVLSSGIHGRVSGFDDGAVKVLIADNVHVMVEKSSIQSVVPKESKESKAADN